MCEVYLAASRAAWGLAAKERNVDAVLTQLPLMLPTERTQLDDEHVFDALVAALAPRAVAMGATDRPQGDQVDLAAEEGRIHVPVRGHRLSELVRG